MPTIKIDKEELRNIESVFSSYTASLEDAAVKTQKASSTLSKMGLSVKPTTLKILTNLNRTKFEEQVASLQMIIEAFDNQDAELKKEAEKILGTENYRKIAEGSVIKVHIEDSNPSSTSGGVPGDYSYVDYQELQEQLMKIQGNKQMYGNGGKKDLSSTKEKGMNGECTTVAPSTLIMRKATVDNHPANVSVQNLWEQQNLGTPFGSGAIDKDKKLCSYQVVAEDKTTINYFYHKYTAKDGFSGTQEEVVQLLQKHPEGITIYVKGHAIVISRYEENTDHTYSFYAYDGVQAKIPGSNEDTECREETPLEKTYLYTCKDKFGFKPEDKKYDAVFSEVLKSDDNYVAYLD